MKLLRIGKIGQEVPAAIDKNRKFRNLSSIIKDLNPENINFETFNKLKKINKGLKNWVVAEPISHPKISLSTFLSAKSVNEVPACSKQAQKTMLKNIKIIKTSILSLRTLSPLKAVLNNVKIT